MASALLYLSVCPSTLFLLHFTPGNPLPLSHLLTGVISGSFISVTSWGDIVNTQMCVSPGSNAWVVFSVSTLPTNPGTKALSSRTLKPFTPLILPIHSKQDYVLMLTRSNILRFLHIWRESVPLLTILCLQFDEDCLFFCQPHNKS